jgi:hypothetical protein
MKAAASSVGSRTLGRAGNEVGIVDDFQAEMESGDMEEGAAFLKSCDIDIC